METTMSDSNLGRTAPVATKATTAPTVAYWTFTGALALQLAFTAYGQLKMPQVAEAFAHLGFPDYFRVELAVLKLAGVVALLAPVPARVKEWAYCGFAITLGSAVYAHVASGEGVAAWGWAAVTAMLWAVSYGLWRRREAR